MRVFHSVDELARAVGTRLGVSDWHVVTQDQVDAFADATSDRQWIHVDVDRAADGPFGATIAHGLLTLSLVPALVRQVYRIENAAMGVNYGFDKVRFTSPVRVGARVRADVELADVVAVEGSAVQIKQVVRV